MCLEFVNESDRKRHFRPLAIGLEREVEMEGGIGMNVPYMYSRPNTNDGPIHTALPVGAIFSSDKL